MCIMRRRAFTLVELLIVVGIIAVLLSILLPVIGQARFRARVIVCASNERQFVAALTSYAIDNNDSFPRFDSPSPLSPNTGADNPHDVTYEFYNTLTTKYQLPHSMFFCPFISELVVDFWWNNGTFVQMGYCYWVPRSTGGALFPPDPGGAFLVNGTTTTHGPSKLGGPLSATNPVLSDDIYLFPNVPVSSPNYVIANAPPSDFYQDDCGHLYNGQIKLTNEAYADGHVEAVTPDRLRWSFLSGNAWVCR